MRPSKHRRYPIGILHFEINPKSKHEQYPINLRHFGRNPKTKSSYQCEGIGPLILPTLSI